MQTGNKGMKLKSKKHCPICNSQITACMNDSFKCYNCGYVNKQTRLQEKNGKEN